jgi:peptidoglycan/xylan/chitin deacetylase (PgdA/CDA1 family)
VRAVLTFHGVDASGSVLSLAPETLRALLAGIRAAGHAIVPLRELLASAEPNRVALSFDDGLASVAENALPVLREQGAVATLFLTTGHVGGHNDWAGQPSWAPKLAMLSWAQVEQLRAAGWEIQSHTRRHLDLRTLRDEALEEELDGACDEIERRVGQRPDQLAFPYGCFDARVLRVAQRHHRHCFTTELADLGSRDARELARGIPRLDAYYLQPAWLHRRFGGAAFRGYVSARALVRRLRQAA